MWTFGDLVPRILWLKKLCLQQRPCLIKLAIRDWRTLLVAHGGATRLGAGDPRSCPSRALRARATAKIRGGCKKLADSMQRAG